MELENNVQATYLKPTDIEHQRYELCGLDLMFGFHYTDMVIFLNADFDIARLEPSLIKTLEQLPVLAGKLLREGERIVLDTDGPGLLVSYAMIDASAPEHDGKAFPISDERLFNGVPSLANSTISDLPLMSIKVTTFADGVRCIGVRHNHAVFDGTGAYDFLVAWNTHLYNRPTEPFHFSRSAVLAIAKTGVRLPSKRSGVRATENQLAVSHPEYFQTQFATAEMSASEYDRLIELVREQFKGIISSNDLMQALVFKAFGLSAGQPDAAPAIANLSYDIRRVKGDRVPMNYFGNAVLFRRLELSFGELRSIPLLELAQRFKQTAESDWESIEQDIGFFQGQYESGNYSPQGVYSAFAPILSNGGLYINNMLSFARLPPLNFGGAEISIYSVFPRGFGIRLAMLIPDTPNRGEVSIRLALERPQINFFQEHWSILLKQVLQQGLLSVSREK